MLKIILGKMVKKHGVKGALLKAGDFFVKVTKSKEDDKLWAKVKKVLKDA